MNVANLHVAKGLVAQKNTTVPQIIQVSITIRNVDDRIADVTCNEFQRIIIMGTDSALLYCGSAWI